MAIVTRRYLQVGAAISRLRAELDPTVTIVPPQVILAVDLSYDDAGLMTSAIDSAMAARGAIPDPYNTSVASPMPFLGLVSPDGSIWKIEVDNAGVISTTEVYDAP